MREAALMASHQALNGEIPTLRAQETELLSKRSIFPALLLGQSRRPELQLKATRSRLAALSAEVQKLNKLLRVSGGMIDRQLEDHLRSVSADYAQHLITAGTPTDWKWLAAIFDRRFKDCQLHLRGFRTVLMQGSAAGMISADVPLVGKKLAQLVASADALDAEIDFINQLGAARQTQPNESSVHHGYPHLNFRDKIEEVFAPHKIVVNEEVSLLALELEARCQPVFQAFTPPVHASDQIGYHAHYWAELRMLAEAALDRSQIDVIVAETKAVFDSGLIIPQPVAMIAQVSPVAPPRAVAPVPVIAPVALPVKESAPPIPAAKAPPVATAEKAKDNLAERENKLLLAEAHLAEREAYFIEVETALLIKLQNIQEQEVYLEQRAEDLQTWETRLQNLEASLDPDVQKPAPPVRKFNEFKE